MSGHQDVEVEVCFVPAQRLDPLLRVCVRQVLEQQGVDRDEIDGEQEPALGIVLSLVPVFHRKGRAQAGG